MVFRSSKVVAGAPFVGQQSAEEEELRPVAFAGAVTVTSRLADHAVHERDGAGSGVADQMMSGIVNVEQVAAPRHPRERRKAEPRGPGMVTESW